MSRKRHLTAGIALTVGLVALTGSALAAPPSTPPGQEKKAEQQAEPAPAATSAPATATSEPTAQSAPAEKNTGQEKKAAKAESSSGINSTTAGVKPSNSTQKHTKCWTGGSSSSPTCQPGSNPDSSKRYGNGKTAAQIAVSRGAPAGTEVRGPGNSQPHKVCGKNGHFIDVHAVKSYVGISCSATTTTTTTQQSQGTVATGNSSTSATSSTSSTSQTGSSQTGSTAGGTATGGVAGATATGGVAGAAVESGSPQSGAAGAGGVLGAFGVAGVAAGTLPFTGFPLWLAILIAIGLIAIGSTLYRRGRPATRDLV